MEKKNVVNLTVIREIDIEAGVTLVPGSYTGIATQLGFPRVDDIAWTAPEYAVQLDELQLRDMGSRYRRATTYDVTKFVRFGDINVTIVDDVLAAEAPMQPEQD